MRFVARRRMVRVAALAGVWTLVALFFTGQYLMAVFQIGRRIPFWTAFAPQAVCWTVWAILAPQVLRLARRFPIEPGRRARRVLLHTGLALIFSVAHNVIETAVFLAAGFFDPRPTFLSALESITVRELHLDVLTYLVIVAVAHFYDYARRERRRELRASRLELRLSRAELQMLRVQLHPHFLFNTLHTISALMHRDVEKADRMMSNLGDLLRLSLDRAGRQEVSLREELEFLERYLEIQQTRFGDRLVVGMSVAPETLDARVPHLILQPLVENAVQHGIAPRAGAGKIEIRSRRRNGTLRLQVVDDGAGLPEGNFAREGLGLSNTRARLVQLYGSDHRFDMRRSENGGVAVTLDIPLRIERKEAVYGDRIFGGTEDSRPDR
jgi:two-component sensor histidine kinase